MRITPSMDDLLTEWKQFDVNSAGQTAPATIPLGVHGDQCHYPGQMGVSLLAERPNFPAAQRGGRADSSSSRAYGLEQRDDGATTDSRSSGDQRGGNKGGIGNADAEDELDAKVYQPTKPFW
ncbi:hypothetical protein CYMTET_3037 [Cymbomonas tetramitiformis]|uniref:Uncharacterized protein n=1 Tax=Cymbomonas tetramitiformis TaxID=36881 RepID=A0AAE0H412_9CHLO|nr:hypothetical protein CYMTET_3037 [Cymbomonas tetramitiformis]